ncbi:MAG: DMT family transporter [Proteobacteria bacterium]|nr:DMT family transporter [Pseudomonadota bacterium]
MDIVYLLLAVVAGATAPIQAGINGQLRVSWAGDSVLVSFISFVVGTLTLGLYMVLTRLPLPSLPTAGQVPWWHWSGGTLGAFFVTMTVLLAYRLGGTTLFALVVAGQLMASLVLDHFGLLGYPVQVISWQRLAGVAFLVVGVVLIRKF